VGIIHVDRARDRIYVSDQISRVHALTLDGQIVGACKPVIGQGRGITGDAEGNLYIVETRVPVARFLERLGFNSR